MKRRESRDVLQRRLGELGVERQAVQVLPIAIGCVHLGNAG
ncbi:MAG: hypothetical protein WAW61_08900 [Methylococcaceae bacterium]